ncbi:SCO4225 family membrane protein [Streptomyces sclerotialus]|uniref:SCO4225 family membrane protein n=1 Tax=Streptomyces sclerotialus TaxID=1957 RepID=UPI000AE18E99
MNATARLHDPATTGPNAHLAAWLRDAGRLTFGNPVSRGYLAVFAAAVVFAVVDSLFVGHPDASMSGVWAALVTSPTLFPLWFAGDALWPDAGAPAWYTVTTLGVAALLNALLLGLVHRGLRGRPTAPRAVVSGGWHTQRHGDH